MQLDIDQRLDVTEPACADRIGMAKLAKMAFDGNDLRPLRRQLIARLVRLAKSSSEDPVHNAHRSGW